jgi:MFS transporter, PAT family, beta-lactamase induction signal transducer AmpG
MSSQSQEKKGAHPAAWVPTLYLAEGLPFITTLTVSVLMYKSLGLTDTQIAFYTSMLGWPWTLKPLWAGFMENYKTKKFFVVGTQLLGGAAFGLLALSLSADAFVRWSLACLAIIAFNSATHDIAADGLYIESLSNADQAKYVGFQSAFWTAGKFLAQFGFVWMAGLLEKPEMLGPKGAWAVTMGAIGGLLLLLGLYHGRVLPSRSTVTRAHSAAEVWRNFVHVLGTFLQKKHVYWGLAFVIFYRFAEGQAQKILPLFLRADLAKGGLAYSTSDVAFVYGMFSPAAYILGAVAGGYFTAKVGLRRALWPLCAAFNLPYVSYLFLAWFQPTRVAIVGSAIVLEYLGYGFGFVAVTLFMMQQMATGKYKMSHYAIATSAMNLGLILPGVWSGWLSDRIGYKYFFAWVMASTLFSFIATAFVPFKSDQEIAEEEQAGAGAGA